MPVNAHAPVKSSTVFIRYCVFVGTSKKHSKTRRVDADFFEEGGKIVLKKMDSFGQSHNISDGRLENLASTYDLKRRKENRSLSISLSLIRILLPV